jgi:hypothetical protein
MLFYDFERGPLTMARGRTGEQRANSLNGLAVPADDAADIALPELQLKDAGPAARNLREHHVVGKFNQLPNDELKKLSHQQNKLTMNEHESTRIFAAKRMQLRGAHAPRVLGVALRTTNAL